MICLTTTARTTDECIQQVRDQHPWIDTVELRVDLLEPGRYEAALGFGNELTAAIGCSLPVIFTVRRPVDGGTYTGSEEDRIDLMVRAAETGGFDCVDLESDLSDTPSGRRVSDAVASAGMSLIRSIHDFGGVPPELVDLVRAAARDDDDLVKIAVMPKGVGDLVTLLETARATSEFRTIMVGMGDYGTITRILTPHFHSLLTYASSPGTLAAPGHLTPEHLCDLYQVRRITIDTPIFAVIGSPIAHSRSPGYHNARFAIEGIRACYVPVLVDDVRDFFRLAEMLPILGFSVTIPHKEAVMAHLGDLSSEVRAIGACNTVFSDGHPRPGDTTWHGANTDVAGFVEPVRKAHPRPLAGERALVIGAGGAARSVVFGLVSEGVSVVITNRSPERARRLVADIVAEIDGKDLVRFADREEAVGQTYDIVAQASSVGMNGDGDAAPWYRFTGNETVFDAVYTPPETPFVVRARDAGCTVVTGDLMFDAQAEAQYTIYRRMAITARGGA